MSRKNTDNKAVTVFLSSSEELSPFFYSEVERLGQAIGEKSWDLVYGGTAQGAMGALAAGFLHVPKTQRGQLIGVVPDAYIKEWAHPQLDKVIACRELSDRKKLLCEEGDIMLAYPGGIGTLDEVMDFLARLQLQMTDKSLVFYNYLRYWEPFLECLKLFEEQSTIPRGFYEKLQVLDNLEAVIECIDSLD